MPIFQYQCTTCGAVLERIEPYNYSKVGEFRHCNACGKARVYNRIISAPAVIKINGYNETNGYSKKGADE